MKKILVAEDDADDQDMFREIVSDLEEKVDLVIKDNGEKLIQFVEQLEDHELPVLILLDQNMPRLKGSETIAQLRRMDRYKDIPAVIYTTYHDSRFKEQCAELGVELLLKPDTFDGFGKMVTYLVDHYVKKNPVIQISSEPDLQ
jgi:CheY-like chemotaxis protein